MSVLRRPSPINFITTVGLPTGLLSFSGVKKTNHFFCLCPFPTRIIHLPRRVRTVTAMTQIPFRCLASLTVNAPYLRGPLDPLEQGALIHTNGLSESTLRRVIAYYYGMVEMIDDCVGRVMDKLN